ncbi:hypothetical protein Btru_077532 [Bulinus truncatus]|nr:hypothetical protein Btru_077532 [Bulinus truncatus]
MLSRLLFSAIGLCVLTLLLFCESQVTGNKCIKSSRGNCRRSQFQKSPTVKPELHITRTVNSTNAVHSRNVSNNLKTKSKKSKVNPEIRFHVNGIFPNHATQAGSGPVIVKSGAVALMPWAYSLYMVTEEGNEAGLYVIESTFKMTKVRDHNSTFANRLHHRQTNQIIIGAWVVDSSGRIRTFEDLLYVRVAATAEHLTSPETMVYMLGMDGPLWECDVMMTLNCSQVFDLVEELHIPASQGEQPHFKAAHTMNGRLVVACITTKPNDTNILHQGGRLAEWKGPEGNWTIIEETAFVEVTGRNSFGRVIYALGRDYRSVILKVLDCEVSDCDDWKTYRLPKVARTFGQTYWPRIREVETGQLLLDVCGLFYELFYESTWGVRPISQHLRVIPDFTSFRGFLVLGVNQVLSTTSDEVVTGQSQSNLWFGKTDDLWNFGKPQGWGAVWRHELVTTGSVSDPYLMTGFDKKVFHVYLHAGQSISLSVQVDFTGSAGERGEGRLWSDSMYVNLNGHYTSLLFPDGYSAHWVRLKVKICYSPKQAGCNVTAHFTYS